VLYHSGPTFGKVLYSCLDAFVVDASDYSSHLIRHLLNASETFPKWFLQFWDQVKVWWAQPTRCICILNSAYIHVLAYVSIHMFTCLFTNLHTDLPHTYVAVSFHFATGDCFLLCRLKRQIVTIKGDEICYGDIQCAGPTVRLLQGPQYGSCFPSPTRRLEY
jgi:hypothetical protein